MEMLYPVQVGEGVVSSSHCEAILDCIALQRHPDGDFSSSALAKALAPHLQVLLSMDLLINECLFPSMTVWLTTSAQRHWFVARSVSHS